METYKKFRHTAAGWEESVIRFAWLVFAVAAAFALRRIDFVYLIFLVCLHLWDVLDWVDQTQCQHFECVMNMTEKRNVREGPELI